ncbi:copper resistance CopC family protein [Schumannella soli]|uniref:copper resistance CopC family protein n=1 Tax=Schumannella soli TaxID=2590779 RepID=UPI0015E86336|nr:copper resistance CopC family protein [Schumannella soli]
MSRASRTTGRATSRRPAGPRALAVIAASALVAALGLAGAVLGVAAPASAHNRVTATVPAADSTVTTLPETFSITTDLALLDLQGGGKGFAVRVEGPDGWSYCPAEPTIVDNVMSVPAVLGGSGAYTLTWQLVSADGHTVSGDFEFSWQAPADYVVPKPGADGNPACTADAADQADADGSASSAPSGPAVGQDGAQVPLGDVLWIGGAILAVLVAGGVTLLLLTRKPRGERTGDDGTTRDSGGAGSDSVSDGRDADDGSSGSGGPGGSDSGGGSSD